MKRWKLKFWDYDEWRTVYHTSKTREEAISYFYTRLWNINEDEIKRNVIEDK